MNTIATQGGAIMFAGGPNVGRAELSQKLPCCSGDTSPIHEAQGINVPVPHLNCLCPPDWLELPCPFLETGGIFRFYPPLPQESKRRNVIEHGVLQLAPPALFETNRPFPPPRIMLWPPLSVHQNWPSKTAPVVHMYPFNSENGLRCIPPFRKEHPEWSSKPRVRT